MNRKLIRPNLNEFKEKASRETPVKKKSSPAYDTHAENYYYLKQMNKKYPIIVALHTGEELEGYLEWYDRNCIKLNRDNNPNLLIFKHAIKYIYKIEQAEEDRQEPSRRPRPSHPKRP